MSKAASGNTRPGRTLCVGSTASESCTSSKSIPTWSSEEAVMDDLETYRRRRANRHKALRRLGVRNIQCLCGEADPECFDVEHIYRSLFDATVWGMCANCHRKKSARERSEHPTVGLHPGDLF